jgi:hypothetical protein
MSFSDDLRTLLKTEVKLYDTFKSISNGPGPTRFNKSEDIKAHHDEKEHDIATCLPELRNLLGLLSKERRNQGSEPNKQGPGNVFLVGTGPGDPELLTVKALKLMQTADLVLYDRLVSTEILDLVHTGARLLYVGKTAGYHSRTQVCIAK